MVLPTGGGKSLCYQAPAVLRGDTTVVVSPLISLMKDQVDGLRECGVAAVQIDSSLSSGERSACLNDLREGAVRLLFLAPERLAMPEFCQLLQQVGVRSFAIDEAHCISHWGHDFRQEYRQLHRLRELFPDASIHAYTATATVAVREDICKQLGLRKPKILVGNFDRPNLTYRVHARQDLMRQVTEVLQRHRGEAGILYCLRRRDVDELTPALQERGYRAVAYHAGLSPEERRQAQEAFAQEECDLVVATVAFGMGIDRSNVRFVLHTAMPKSLEHYQQETGRAGRDGLEAECILLFSGQDFLSWKWLMGKSASEPGVDPSFLPNAMKHLSAMANFCKSAVCRHRALVEYFGQRYPAPSCSACDLCLGDTEEVADATVIAQKILSCVARVKESFGVNHVVGVLRGENTVGIRKWGHEKLSTHGLLASHSKEDIRDWVYQLVGQGVLLQSGDEYPVLRLNEASWDIMRGKRQVRLAQLMRREPGTGPKKSRAETTSWEGVDAELFENLRVLRKRLAEERSVPPYVIFSDATLRELARQRPSTLQDMHMIYGIGEAKLRDFGPKFLEPILEANQRLGPGPQDMRTSPVPFPEPRRSTRSNPAREQAFALFRKKLSLDAVAEQTQRARSTVVHYLVEFIQSERPAAVAAWVDDATYHLVKKTMDQGRFSGLKPISLALEEKVPYEAIRVVLAHLRGGEKL